jgi:hypothetical protein
MAKGQPKRKPQSQTKEGSTAQKIVSSPPNRNQGKANELIADSVPRWRDKLHELWVEVLAAAILGGGLVGLGLLYLVEYRGHESTKARLARAEKDRDQVIGERDQARKELKDTRQENADLKKLHPILEFYGPHAKFIANYDLKKEVGSTLALGNCMGAPCIFIGIRGIRQHNNVERAEFLLSGNAEFFLSRNRETGMPSYQYMHSFHLIIKQGCSFTFKSRLHDMTFTIEEDRMTSVRAGVATSPGTHLDEGFRTSMMDGC